MYQQGSPRSQRRDVGLSPARQSPAKPPLGSTLTGGNGRSGSYAGISQTGGGGGGQTSPGRTRKNSRGSIGSGVGSESSGGRHRDEISGRYGDGDIPYRDYSSAMKSGSGSGSVNPAFSMSQAYLGSGGSGGPPNGMFTVGSTASLSPFHTGSPARVNNLHMTTGSKTKSLSLLVADRSMSAMPMSDHRPATADYNGSGARTRASLRSARDIRLIMSGSTGGGPVTYDRDQSLDRHVDRRHQRHPGTGSSAVGVESDSSRFHTIGGYGKDRGASAEREYPHMGARSLERGGGEPGGNGLFRSRSIDHEYLADEAAFYPSPPDPRRHTHETFVLDLQSQVAELNKECAVLQQDLDVTREKLSASMNSIKTFWSPELKKERAVRKEEATRHMLLIEQLKMAEVENRQHLSTLTQLEQENRVLRDLSLSSASSGSSLTTTGGGGGGGGNGGSRGGVGAGVVVPDSETAMRREKERHAKELKLLRKTIEEMELRIETQKQTLTTRDESIKKLMDMLQAKSSSARLLEDERMISDEARHIKQLEQLLEQKDSEMGRLREDSRVKALETELKSARDELIRLSENEGSNGREQLDTLRHQERILKEKLESTRAELARKEAESGALQTQIDTLKKHWEDHERHITVLREQICAKDEQANMVQSDLEMLRDRVAEKDELIDKKSKQLGVLATEKKRLDSELTELKEQLDTRDRKLTALQRKVSSLEDSVKEKETEVTSIKSKLAALQADHSSSGSAMSSLESLLAEREKQIDKLKEQRERSDRQYEEEMESISRKSSDYKTKLEALQAELTEKQQQEVELREESSRLKTERLMKESYVSRLETSLSEKTDQLAQLQNKLRKLEDQMDDAVTNAVSAGDKKLLAMKKEMETIKSESSSLRAEVDRYCAQLVLSDKEKFEKDRRIKELTEQLDECKQKLKQIQLAERNTSDAGGGPGGDVEEITLLKGLIHDKEDRIYELEEALRESIKITAQREVVMHEQQMKQEHSDRLMESMHEEMVSLKKSLDDSADQLLKTKRLLDEKDEDLKAHRADSRRRLADVYEMKQEAILAAISEKDAHIALLEMAPNKKVENIEEVGKLSREKIRLQQVLKDLTQSRMKLLQNRTTSGDSPPSDDQSPSPGGDREKDEDSI